MDNLQEFIDSEIAKKEVKERIKLERAIENVGSTVSAKKSWEQEIKEDTKVSETAEEYLRYYFGREKVIMEKLFGSDWKRHLNQPQWPRGKYVPDIEIEDERSGSVSSLSSFPDDQDRKKKAQKLQSAHAKAKGIISFLQKH